LHHLRPAERAEGDLRRLRATRERIPQSEPKEELMKFVASVRAATEQRRAEEAKPKSAEEIALDLAFGKMVPK
jgi:hypothetical protein